MDNMQCCGIERFFDGKEADKDFAAYRKKGPVKTTRMLIDALKADGVQGSTLLDIGGGVGAIQHELLKAGASSAVSIEAATAYIEAARVEADRQGVADRLVHRHGDFVAMAKELEQADIVTLDRVVCCYDDMEGLVGLSLEKARGLYALVYPRDTWPARVVLWFANIYYRLRRCPFRIFLHSTAAIDRLVRSHGFELKFHQKTRIWHVAVYGRAGSPAS